ncbi:TetR/AcrR family transcriptional regulator [Nocardia harenae]|uniref:TetR/AcrR family transcriptional regulator n=1 Tax=Nocardia harenae TaxID=358707 RepID=UPI00083343D2|nr:TetR/AcrR family transcriptional regulator [Nocardia harenae]
MSPTTSTSPSHAPRRLRADAARNQERIVAAARELFGERGLEISLDDVAERAGVGVGTVYRRFAGKKELIVQVFARQMDDFVAAAERAGRNPDPWAGLVEFFEYACRHLAGSRGFSEVILELDDRIERFAELRERMQPPLNRIVERARAAGDLHPDVQTTDLFALVHMIDSFAEFCRPVAPETWRRYLAVALNGVRGDGAARLPLCEPALTEEQIEQAKGKHCPSRRR